MSAMTIAPAEYDFRAARRRLEAKPKSAGEKLTSLEDAAAPLAKAAGILTGNSVIQDHHGDVLARSGRSADAVAAWERALAGDGESIDRAAIEKKIKAAKSKK